MKINLSLDYDMQHDEQAFDTPFFRQFDQTTYPLRLNEQFVKEYHFPTFYGNVTSAMGLFLCSYDKACELMPHPALQPVKMTPQKSLIVFSCYNYKKVKEILPFYEVGMVIPVLLNPGFNLPLLPMLFTKVFRNLGYYIFHMPLTSLENKIRGDNIWGLPKVVQEIHYEQEHDYTLCTINDEHGTCYFSLRIPMKGQKKEVNQSASIYSYKDNRLLQSTTSVSGTFFENRFMKQLFSPQKCPIPYLEFGESHYAAMLQRLEIDAHPFQTRYGEGISSCFTLPHDTLTFSERQK